MGIEIIYNALSSRGSSFRVELYATVLCQTALKNSSSEKFERSTNHIKIDGGTQTSFASCAPMMISVGASTLFKLTPSIHKLLLLLLSTLTTRTHSSRNYSKQMDDGNEVSTAWKNQSYSANLSSILHSLRLNSKSILSQFFQVAAIFMK